MIGLLKILAVYLFVMLFTNNISKAQTYPQPTQNPPTPRATTEIQKFNNRLQNIYGQSNQDTYGQQVIYGFIEGLATWKLGTLIPPRDKAAIQSIQKQLTALEDKTARNIPGVEQISEQERKAKIAALQRKLKVIEGSLGERLGRGTTKLFVRGAQVFLVAQIASRIYILTALDARDPGFYPLPSFVCSGLDCNLAVEKVIETSDRAYRRARRSDLPEVTVPAPVTPAPVVTPTPTPAPTPAEPVAPPAPAQDPQTTPPQP